MQPVWVYCGESAHNDLMTLGTGGHHRDGHTDLLLNEQHIVLRSLGELIPLGGATDVALPAGERGVDGLCMLELVGHR